MNARLSVEWASCTNSCLLQIACGGVRLTCVLTEAQLRRSRRGLARELVEGRADRDAEWVLAGEEEVLAEVGESQ